MCRQNHAATQIQRLLRGWMAKKHYHTQRNLVIHLQSCIRQRLACKRFLSLRNEARSATHLKELSYALEMKVVELTQTLTTVRDEKKALTDRTTQLETQIRTWVDKYEKLERKSKGFEEKLKEPTVPMEKWQALEVERDTWMNDHKQLADQLKTKTRDTDELTAKLETQTQETGKLKQDLDEANDKVKTMVEAATVVELKSQIAALKAQLSQALHAPRRQPSSTTMHNSSLAPGGNSNARSVSPIMSPSTSIIKQQKQQHDEQLLQKEKTSSSKAAAAKATPSINDAQSPASPTPGLSRARVGGRRNSSAEQTETQPKSSLDTTLPKSKIATAAPRPTSVDQYSKLLGAKAIHHEVDLDEDSIAEVRLGKTPACTHPPPFFFCTLDPFYSTR